MKHRENVVMIELRCCGFKDEDNMPVRVPVHVLHCKGEILDAWCSPEFRCLTPYIKREEVRAKLPLECVGL